jgi:lipid-binding SYLF domain-containing protein
VFPPLEYKVQRILVTGERHHDSMPEQPLDLGPTGALWILLVASGVVRTMEVAMLTRRCFHTALAMSAVSLIVGEPAICAAADTAEREKIDGEVNNALTQLYSTVPGSKDVAAKSTGMLVFPTVYQAGIGIGGEYGRGALRTHDKSVGYYSTAGASFGLQLGAQARSIVFMFLTQEALTKFQNSSGWDVGGDASVALVKTGADGSIDTNSLQAPVVVFIFGNTGLMANLSLKGTKISKLDI